MAARYRGEGAVLHAGHVGQDHHALCALAGEPLPRVVVGVVDVAVERKAAVVEPAPGNGAHLLDVVGRRDVDRAAGELAVDGLHHRVAHDAVELRGSAQGVVDPPDAAGPGVGAPVRAVLPLPERVLRVGHGRGQEIAGDPEPGVGVVVDGDRLELVDAGVELRHRLLVVVPFRTMYPRRSNSYFCSGVRAKAESVEVIFRVLLFAPRAGDGVRPVAARGQEVQRLSFASGSPAPGAALPYRSYPASPCSFRSSPLVSVSSSTRRPMARSMSLRITNETIRV